MLTGNSANSVSAQMNNNFSGQMLGKYLLQERLKDSHFSDLYRAHDHELKREVAVKTFDLDKSNKALQACFIREAENAAALEHRQIVRIYDYGIESNINYIAMQHVTGGTLLDRMKRAAENGLPRISLTEVIHLLQQVASALDYAHAQDVIHGDIKPQHVKFDTRGQPFIVDFGISRIWSIAYQYAVLTSVRWETFTYWSPEQMRGYGIVPASDQYALALMVYELITGGLPFETKSLIEFVMAKTNKEPKSIIAFNVDVPAALSLVLDRALATDPNGRYPSCMAFATAFTAAVAGAE